MASRRSSIACQRTRSRRYSPDEPSSAAASYQMSSEETSSVVARMQWASLRAARVRRGWICAGVAEAVERRIVSRVV